MQGMSVRVFSIKGVIVFNKLHNYHASVLLLGNYPNLSDLPLHQYIPNNIQLLSLIFQFATKFCTARWKIVTTHKQILLPFRRNSCFLFHKKLRSLYTLLPSTNKNHETYLSNIQLEQLQIKPCIVNTNSLILQFLFSESNQTLLIHGASSVIHAAL